MTGPDILDLRGQQSGGTGELSQTTINIIEENLNTQVDHRIGHTEVTEVDVNTIRAEQWVDATKVIKLRTTTLTFTAGDLTQVVSVNEDENITVTKTVSWSNGYPTVTTV